MSNDDDALRNILNAVEARLAGIETQLKRIAGALEASVKRPVCGLIFPNKDNLMRVCTLPAMHHGPHEDSRDA